MYSNLTWKKDFCSRKQLAGAPCPLFLYGPEQCIMELPSGLLNTNSKKLKKKIYPQKASYISGNGALQLPDQKIPIIREMELSSSNTKKSSFLIIQEGNFQPLKIKRTHFLCSSLQNQETFPRKFLILQENGTSWL